MVAQAIQAFLFAMAPDYASTGSVRFAAIYPTSLVGSITCAMMLSEPCVLITTPVFNYPGQLHAVTRTVAVISSAPANPVKIICVNCCFYLIHRSGLLHIKINTIGQNTPDNSRQFIRQRNRGFQPPDGPP